MRSGFRTWHSIPAAVQLLALLCLVLAWGCDRTDNDWGLYDPDLKLIHIDMDTLRLDEAGGAQRFDVAIGMVPDDTVFVYPVSLDTQVAVRPESLFFAPVDDDWLKPRIFEVEAIEDRREEGDHFDQIAFTVRSNDPAYDGQAWDVLIPVLLRDNDTAGVLVSETRLTLVESDLGAVYESYRLKLASEPAMPVTVDLTITPEEPSLHVSPTSVLFDSDNWDTEQEISLWIELDGIDFDYQSLVISHSAASIDTNYGPSLSIPTIDLDIFDDTLPPVATVAPVPATDLVDENSTTGYDVTVTLSRPSVIPVVVHLATIDGTARAGIDYVGLDQDLTFVPGDPLTQTLTVMPLDDVSLEETENLEVVITAVSGCVIGAEDRVDIRILDDDVVVLTLTATDTDEDSGAADFEVSIPVAAEFPVSFTFVTADGTALAGQDYEGVDEAFVLEPGELARTIPVVLRSDDVHEPDETFTAALTDISVNASWAGPPVVCTILNDDPQNIVFDDITHHEGDGTAVFNLTLLRPYPQDVNLTVRTLEGDGLNGAADEVDALDGQDYAGTTGTSWTISAGATSGTFPVTLINDAQAESLQEYFRLEISSSSHPDFLGLTAQCTLVDDHQPCLAGGDVTVAESGGTATFTLGLFDEMGAAVTSTADVILQVDTMDQTAASGSDYDAVSMLVTIPRGQHAINIPVTVNDDPHDDDNETFVLLITDHVNAVGNCDTEPPFATIVDDEFPSINIQSVARRLNEGSVFTFNVSLTTQRQTTTIFDLDLLPGTSQGESVDYSFADTGPQSIPPFTDFITFTVPFLDDQLEGELDEVIEVTIANANCALGVVSLEATIVDAPELSIVGDNVLEGEVAYFTVTADAPSTADMTFQVQHSSGTAITGVDFSDANTGPFTIPAGNTTILVPVATVGSDGGDNALEEYYVTLISPANATNSPFNSAPGQITDGDPPTLTWAGTASAVEGDDIIFTVNLDWASTANVQFSVSFTDGTAARLGIDYDDANLGPFTVAPGNLFYQVAVPTTVDGLPELASEDFTITLQSPVNALLGTPASTTGFVLDGDQPALNFQVDQSGTEGSTLTFTVELSTTTTVPVFFDIQYDNGSTQGALDFDVTNVGPFFIAAGNTTATVTVDTIDDVELEGAESFIIRVANPVNALPGVDFEASGTIIDND
jgi:hypothetical protein